MARGSPDYGIPDYSFFTVETPVSDVVSERQGFSRLDNRGRVLWFEDWRGGLSRMSADYDSLSSQVAHIYHNDFGIGYHGIVTLDPLANNGYASLANAFMLPVSKRIGLEFGFKVPSHSGLISAFFSHNYLAGTAKMGILQVQADAASINIVTPTGYPIIFTPASPLYLQLRFVAIKFVIDVELNKYVRVMLGNTQYDISSYDLNNGGVGLSGDTYINVGIEGVSATNKNSVDIAYVIISGDEP